MSVDRFDVFGADGRRIARGVHPRQDADDLANRIRAETGERITVKRSPYE